MFKPEELIACFESRKSMNLNFLFERRDQEDFDNSSSEEHLYVAQLMTDQRDLVLPFWIEFERRCINNGQTAEDITPFGDAQAISDAYRYEPVSEFGFASAFRGYASGTIRNPISVRYPREREDFLEGMLMISESDTMSWIGQFKNTIIAFEWGTSA